MVVCRFFQQGHCRYGQNCRFEHIYGSKYSYHANPTPQAAPPQHSELTDEQLVNQVQADIQSALRGGQWILSCYSPYKEKPIFPGISDLSPEETRLFIYEAKNNNNLEQAVNYINNLYKDTRQKYEQLLQPNVNIIKVLRSLYKGEIVQSPFTNTSSGSDNASSIFRSAVQGTQPVLTSNNNTAASIFSQGQNSIFNIQPDQAKDLFSRANNTSIFGQTPVNTLGSPHQDQAKSIFSSAVQSTNNQFNTAIQPNPSNIFSAQSQSIFGQPNQNSSPFGQTQNNSIFNQSQNNSPFAQGNIFQKADDPKSIFGQASNQFGNSSDSGVYSTMDELTEADLEAYKSDSFSLGFIPEMAPPVQLCTGL